MISSSFARKVVILGMLRRSNIFAMRVLLRRSNMFIALRLVLNGAPEERDVS